MSRKSYGRMKAAKMNGTPVHKPKREIVEPEPRGEAEEGKSFIVTFDEISDAIDIAKNDALREALSLERVFVEPWHTQDEYNEWRRLQQRACEHNEGAWIGQWPQTAIRHCTKKLPNGELCMYAVEVIPGKNRGPTVWVSPNKKRTLWNWFRKLAGR